MHRNCLCPEDGEDICNPASNETCPYIEAVERAAGALGLSPPEQSSGQSGQLMRHTVLLIVYAASMFLVCYFFLNLLLVYLFL